MDLPLVFGAEETFSLSCRHSDRWHSISAAPNPPTYQLMEWTHGALRSPWPVVDPWIDRCQDGRLESLRSTASGRDMSANAAIKSEKPDWRE